MMVIAVIEGTRLIEVSLCGSFSGYLFPLNIKGMGLGWYRVHLLHRRLFMW